ncbi:MAG: TlyA family RNA methyltransferase [Propionibacteriaceae bacterium]|nr:TlyA family RNA methyltransferase [Propionibacteriaceae bacterium]
MRLDLALVDRGSARSRSHARQLIDSDRVRVAGVSRVRASTQVGEDAVIDVLLDHYVSRGAHKLVHALDECGLSVAGRVLDAGASTGGFTQVLLERGARQVYAVDVGHGQMAGLLRDDTRVVLREGVNLKDLDLDTVGGHRVDLVVADVSFISLRLILDRLLAVVAADGAALVLVKPQFEVGRGGLDSHGVVVDDDHRARAVAAVVACARDAGWSLAWSAPSAVIGEKGNQEVFCLFRRGEADGESSTAHESDSA